MPTDSSHQIGQSVGMRLRTARLAKKYTQNQLARPDFSVSYISAIERGQIQPSLRALEILARRLELSTTDLLPVRSSLAGGASAENGAASTGSEEQELLLLEAQIAIHQREPRRASELLQGSLARKGEKQQEKASVAYYLLGWAYLEEGRLQESEQALAEAARLAREGVDPFYPCILGLQGAVYTAMHNSEQAVQLRRESLRILAHPPETGDNVFFLARLHSSLAQHYSSLGEFPSAIEEFQRALHLLETQNSCQQHHEIYQKLLNDYAEKELYSLATLYSYKWLLANFRCQLTSRRGEMEHALGSALLQSDPEEAHRYLLDVLREAEIRKDALAMAGANVQLASWMIKNSELDQAEGLVQQAQSQAEPFGETVIYAAARLLAGELAYRRQDYDTGDSCFEAGLALLEQVGAREDLVEHLARYAQLLEERNCIQKALNYWKRAYEGHQENHRHFL